MTTSTKFFEIELSVSGQRVRISGIGKNIAEVCKANLADVSFVKPVNEDESNAKVWYPDGSIGFVLITFAQ